MSIGVVLGTLAIVAGVIALGVVIDRRWSILPRKGEYAKAAAARAAPPPDPPGTTPAAALRVPMARLPRLLAAQRCASCKKRIAGSPDDGEQIVLGERALVVFRLTCASCRASRALYVETGRQTGAV
jgi:hypothetical protein